TSRACGRTTGSPASGRRRARSREQTGERVGYLGVGRRGHVAAGRRGHFESNILCRDRVWPVRPPLHLRIGDLGSHPPPARASGDRYAGAAMSAGAGEILDGLGDAVIALSHDQLVLYWSRQAEAMFGFPAARVLGGPLPPSIGLPPFPGGPAE